MRSTTFILFAVALCVLAVTHILAITFFLYWTYLWFDIPMHALGGMVVALGFLTFLGTRLDDGFQRGLLATLGAVFVVGILWEFFELAIGFPSSEANYVGDTALDFVMNLVGASVGYVCARVATRFNRTSS